MILCFIIGGGTDPAMARYFDPQAYRIILVDQRGCGKSKPFADLRENTTCKSTITSSPCDRHGNLKTWTIV